MSDLIISFHILRIMEKPENSETSKALKRIQKIKTNYIYTQSFA